jgi:hypothetical protein
MKRLLLCLAVAVSLGGATKPVTEAAVRAALTPLDAIDIDTLKAMGPPVLPHLVRIYESTRDEKARATQIHTGQTKGFAPNADEAARLRAIEAWTQWLAEYEKNL